MWIRNTLIALPVVLVLFLLSSWFWVPKASEVSQDPTRLERLVVSLPQDIKSLNPWFSNSAYDSDVHGYIQEGLATADGFLKPIPNLGRKIGVGEDVVVVLAADEDAASIEEKLSAAMTEQFPVHSNSSGDESARVPRVYFAGTRPYHNRDFMSHSLGRDGPTLANRTDSPPNVPAEAPDGSPRIVLQFRVNWEVVSDPKEIPSAVVADIADRIDRVMGDGWATKWSKEERAIAQYRTQFSVGEGPDLTAAKGEDEAALKAARSKLVEEWGKSATESARQANSAAPDFASYLAAFPASRVLEHPVLEIHLQEGVKWHDFEESKAYFDVEDVLFTYDFARHPDVNTDNKTYVNQMLQMRIHGSHRFDLVYKEMYSPALFHLTYAKILPRHRFTAGEWTKQAIRRGRGPSSDKDESFNYRRALPPAELDFTQMPVGTGPLKIHPLNGKSLPAWRNGELVRLERFDDYWNPEDLPQFKYLDFYIIDEDMGAESAEVNFAAGGMDLYAIRPHQVKSFESKRDRYYIYKRPNLQYTWFGLNLQNEILKDIRVRQALALATDVDSMIRVVNYGQARRVSGPAYPMLPYYNHDYIPNYTWRTGPHEGKTLREVFEAERARQESLPEDQRDPVKLDNLKYMPFNMEEAQALLREAGWVKNNAGKLVKDGQEMSLRLTYGGTSNTPGGKVCTLARERWVQLGVDIKIEEMEFNVFISERLLARNFDIVTLGWNGGIDYDKRKLWSSDQVPMAGYNFTTFNSPEADQLFKDMLKEYDTDRIIEMSHRAFQIIADAQPYIFLSTPYSNIAVDRHLYWAKPVLQPDGSYKREPLPMTDGEQMDLPYGPRTNRMQHVRGESPMFPPVPTERVVVGEKTLYRDLFPNGPAQDEEK